MSTQNPTWPEPPLGSVVRVTYTRLSYTPDDPGEQATFVAERAPWPHILHQARRWYVVGSDDGATSWEDLLATTTAGGTPVIASIDRVEVTEWRPWEPS
jgi:hypothetical protein